MNKRDRQGVRTPAGLEQKYNFGNVFSRLDSENNEQNLTMRQFAELVTETIATIQKDIKTLNTSLTDSVKTLSAKDAELEQDMENSDKSLDSKIAAYWKTIYPVGAIYVSVSSTSPATLFGGTWTQIKDTFLLASGSTYSAGSTGGEATHKLTVAEMPQHGHAVYVWDAVGTTGNAWYYNGATKTTHAGARIYNSSAGTWVSSGSQALVAGEGRGDPSGGTNLVGSGTAHNNMPPYLAVYVWKRTA